MRLSGSIFFIATETTFALASWQGVLHQAANVVSCSAQSGLSVSFAFPRIYPPSHPLRISFDITNSIFIKKAKAIVNYMKNYLTSHLDSSARRVLVHQLDPPSAVQFRAPEVPSPEPSMLPNPFELETSARAPKPSPSLLPTADSVFYVREYFSDSIEFSIPAFTSMSKSEEDRSISYEENATHKDSLDNEGNGQLIEIEEENEVTNDSAKAVVDEKREEAVLEEMGDKFGEGEAGVGEAGEEKTESVTNTTEASQAIPKDPHAAIRCSKSILGKIGVTKFSKDIPTSPNYFSNSTPTILSTKGKIAFSAILLAEEVGKRLCLKEIVSVYIEFAQLFESTAELFAKYPSEIESGIEYTASILLEFFGREDTLCDQHWKKDQLIRS